MKTKARKTDPHKDPLKAGKQLALQLNALVSDADTQHLDMKTILNVHEIMGCILDRLEEAEALLAGYALNAIGPGGTAQLQRLRLGGQAIIADYKRRHPRRKRKLS